MTNATVNLMNCQIEVLSALVSSFAGFNHRKGVREVPGRVNVLMTFVPDAYLTSDN